MAHAAPAVPDVLDGLRAADEGGYNCVHFDEFVFLPRPGEDLRGTDYRRLCTRYYFYQVEYPFLLRAWKNGIGLDNRTHAGHLLSGSAEVRPYPTDFALRHDIALSEEHARLKYPARAFDEGEIAFGWHGDRLRATTAHLAFPSDDDAVRVLPHAGSREFDRSAPCGRHFWDWSAAERLSDAV